MACPLATGLALMLLNTTICNETPCLKYLGHDIQTVSYPYDSSVYWFSLHSCQFRQGFEKSCQMRSTIKYLYFWRAVWRLARLWRQLSTASYVHSFMCGLWLCDMPTTCIMWTSIYTLNHALEQVKSSSLHHICLPLLLRRLKPYKFFLTALRSRPRSRPGFPGHDNPSNLTVHQGSLMFSTTDMLSLLIGVCSSRSNIAQKSCLI
ncbi:uncharacterized protein EDB91DRAFT_1337266, partial [Suillus paluster]|uniref:uncharacterized protein n=1 Tax=Suillus paluster TaxID=48578 RepID=UPI001B85E421